MTTLLDRILLPVASVEDAEATCRAVRHYLAETETIRAVHVIEKAGGAPDKASVEQREGLADDIFATVETVLDSVETELRYDTDVKAAILAGAEDFDATAIVFTPRGGSRWLQLLTGDLTLQLVTAADRPVVVLPDRPADGASHEEDA